MIFNDFLDLVFSECSQLVKLTSCMHVTTLHALFCLFISCMWCVGERCSIASVGDDNALTVTILSLVTGPYPLFTVDTQLSNLSAHSSSITGTSINCLWSKLDIIMVAVVHLCLSACLSHSIYLRRCAIPSR